MGLLLTYPGVPSIFAGDELGLKGAWGEDSRRTINWEDQSSWDKNFHDLVQQLIAIRKSSHALAYGGLRWLSIEDDYVAYLRESDEESVVVVVARTKTKIEIDLAAIGYEIDDVLFGPHLTGKTISGETSAAEVMIVKLREFSK